MLIGELIAALGGLVFYGVAAAVAIVEVLFALLSVVGEVLALVFDGRRARQTPAKASPVAPDPDREMRRTRRRKWLRRIGIASGAGLVLTVLVAVLLNTVFFDWTVRRIFNTVGSRTGTTITFDDAEGSLFTGRLRLINVSLVRSNHPSMVFDLRARNLAVDLDVPSMIRGNPKRIEDAMGIGLRGTVEQVGEGERKPAFARKAVHLDRLTLNDAEIEWIDRTRPPGEPPRTVPIVVKEFEGQQLRTNWIAFDLLFRTNGSGTVAGQPFSVTNKASADGGTEAVWRFERLPAPLIGAYVGGPLAWIESGEGTVTATTVRADPKRGLVMDWQLELANVRATPPPGLEGWRGRLASSFVDHVNLHGERLPLGFTFELDHGGFEGAATPAAAGLWSAVANAATKEIAKGLKLEPERIEGVKGALRERLEQFRKPKPQAAPATTPASPDE